MQNRGQCPTLPRNPDGSVLEGHVTLGRPDGGGLSALRRSRETRSLQFSAVVVMSPRYLCRIRDVASFAMLPHSQCFDVSAMSPRYLDVSAMSLRCPYLRALVTPVGSSRRATSTLVNPMEVICLLSVEAAMSPPLEDGA